MNAFKGNGRSALAAATSQIKLDYPALQGKKVDGVGIRLRHMTQVGPSASEIRNIKSDDMVTFAPMETLADGKGGLDASVTRALNEVIGGSYNYFAEGDVLLAKVTPCFENGKKAVAHGLSNGIGFATSEVHVIRPDSRKLDADFLCYLLSSKGFQTEGIQSMTGAGGLRRVSERAILDHSPVVTDLEAQRTIAAFLDRETARIDSLMEKKRRLLELLDEKRAALVTAAVVGQIGSDQLAPKVSARVGEKHFWPEECPFPLRPLKRICELDPEMLSESTDSDYEFEYIDIGNVTLNAGICVRQPMVFGDAPSRARKSVRAGDVIVSTVRTYLKAVAAIDAAADRWVVSTGFAVFRPQADIDPKFLYRTVQSNPFIDSVVAASTGVSYPAISSSNLGNIPIPLPNLEVQRAIVAFLDRETSHLDQLKSRTETSLNLLREYRAALITAAVTGQIDPISWRRNGGIERDLDAIEEEEHA